MLFCLLFVACGGLAGDVGGSLNESSSDSQGKASSSSKNEASSSSSECLSLDYIVWSEAPGNSYMHSNENGGNTQIGMDAYYISAFLIKQGQYKTIMGGENPSKGTKNDTLPVEGVTWFKAEEFCKKLSVRMCLDSNAVRIPTEAQWEYAEVASVILRDEKYWEWTNDCFDSRFPWTDYDPSGPPNCSRNFVKVRKGLNFYYNVRYSTDPYSTDISGGHISFRVAVKNKDL